MIVKAHQPIRELHFGHMAARAIARGDGTRFGCLASRGFCIVRGMTGETLFVVRYGLSDKVLMWIMTGDATDARIRAAEAFAVCESIRLKANVNFPSPMTADDHFPTAMALPAKIRDIFRRESLQVWRCGLGTLPLKCRDQVRARPGMAVFAGDTRFKMVQRQPSVAHRAS